MLVPIRYSSGLVCDKAWHAQSCNTTLQRRSIASLGVGTRFGTRVCTAKCVDVGSCQVCSALVCKHALVSQQHYQQPQVRRDNLPTACCISGKLVQAYTVRPQSVHQTALSPLLTCGSHLARMGLKAGSAAAVCKAGENHPMLIAKRCRQCFSLSCKVDCSCCMLS